MLCKYCGEECAGSIAMLHPIYQRHLINLLQYFRLGRHITDKQFAGIHYEDLAAACGFCLLHSAYREEYPSAPQHSLEARARAQLEGLAR